MDKRLKDNKTYTTAQKLPPSVKGLPFHISSYCAFPVHTYPPVFLLTTVPVDLLTHWRRVTHICVSKLTIIASDSGLSPGRRQAIIWTSAGILLIGSLGTKFSETLIGIQTSSFMKMQLKMSSAKWRPFCPGLNVLTLNIARPVDILTFIGRRPSVATTLIVRYVCFQMPLAVTVNDLWVAECHRSRWAMISCALSVCYILTNASMYTP